MPRLLFILSCFFLSWSVVAPAQTSRERAAEIRRAIDLLQEGRQLNREQDYQRALMKLEESRQIMESPMVLYQLGECYANMGNYREAIDTLNLALVHNPEFSEARRALSDAEEDLQRQIEEAAALEQQRQLEAEHAARAAMEGQPHEVPSVPSKDDQALSAVPTTSGGEPAPPLQDAADRGTADSAPRAMPRSTPDGAPRVSAGQTPGVTTDDTTGSVGVASDTTSMEPPMPQPSQQELALILFPQQGGKSTNNVIEQFIGETDTDVVINSAEWHYYQGQEFLKQNMYDRAAAEFQAAIQRDADHMKSHLELAAALDSMGRQLRAAERYRIARERFPERPEPFYESGNFYMKSVQQYDTAIEYFEMAIVKDSNFTKSYNNLGTAYIYNENYPMAEAALKKGIEKDPNNPKYYRNLAFIYDTQYGDLEKARDALQKYIELGGSDQELAQQWMRHVEQRLAASNPD